MQVYVVVKHTGKEHLWGSMVDGLLVKVDTSKGEAEKFAWEFAHRVTTAPKRNGSSNFIIEGKDQYGATIFISVCPVKVHGELPTSKE